MQKPRKLREFLVKKFFRLYPAYWVAVILTFIAAILWLPERSVSIKDALVNFTMFQGVLGFRHVDGAYWTLTYDVLLYIDICIILLLGLGKKTDFVVLGWSVLMLLPQLFPALNNTPWSYFYKVARPFMLWGYGQIFCGGAALYLILFGEKRNKIISSLALICCIVREMMIGAFVRCISFAAILVLVSLAAIAEKKDLMPSDRILRLTRPLTFIASISYPLYLLHQNIGYVIIRAMESVGLTSELWLIVPVGAMILLAYIVHQLVEIPCGRIAYRLCRREKC